MLTRRRIFLIVYVFSVLLFFEACLRLAVRHEQFVLKLYSDDNERFWRLWFAQRARPDDQAVFYCHQYSPTRGWSISPNLRDVHCMPTHPDKFLNTNAHGLRGRREFAYAKNPGQQRLAVFGDSFTFGEEVSDDETYLAYLAEQFPQAEIMNFGVRGYGYDQMLLYLKEEGVKYHPDVVLLAFNKLDLARDRLAFRDAAKPRFRLNNGQLELQNSPVPTAQQVMAAEPFQLKMLDLLSLLATKLHGAEERRQESEQLAGALLEEFDRTVRAIPARPIYFYMPVLEELRDPSPDLNREETLLKNLCARLHSPCIQLRPAFQKSGKKLLSEGHWSPQEHRIAAQALGPGLLSR
ncbi:MAG: SGNH/GDSL hydrolase family protein [Candidatus Eremiobacteraeota bacterium]|nr:SGNH/GDSL hydrolase family protein [Candidatus Eremiobacteraeota bacterium]